MKKLLPVLVFYLYVRSLPGVGPVVVKYTQLGSVCNAWEKNKHIGTIYLVPSSNNRLRIRCKPVDVSKIGYWSYEVE